MNKPTKETSLFRTKIENKQLVKKLTTMNPTYDCEKVLDKTAKL
jgi:hypothetical protein